MIPNINTNSNEARPITMTATAHCGNHALSATPAVVTPLLDFGNTNVKIKAIQNQNIGKTKYNYTYENENNLYLYFFSIYYYYYLHYNTKY